LVLLAAIGCGGNQNEGEVSGTVTYQGKPLPIGTVSFLGSSNQGLASSAIYGGKYKMPVKVPVGLVKITVTTPRNRPKIVLKFNNPSGNPVSVIAIPAKYGSADQSGLTYTVKPGANTYNIELQ
jgi:hypothetical protein